LPDTITRIGDRAFFNCISLESIRIPSRVKVIGKEAFGNCCRLRTVILEDGIKKIGRFAFISCWALRSISLPSSLKKMDNYAFLGCEKLNKKCLGQIAALYKNTGKYRDFVSVVRDDLEVAHECVRIEKYCGRKKKVTIPASINGDTVKFIESGAFKNNRS
jgi:hypothetical protein